MGTVTFSFKKHHGPIPADDIAPQIITDCGNLRLDFKQLGLWASQPFLETLGHWFPNEIQNLLSSEKRTLDYWAAVQFFFSLALRRLWQLLPNSLTRVVPRSSSWSSPKFLNQFWLTSLSRLQFSQLVVHLFLPHFFPTQHFVNILGYSTLLFFGNECLWLILLVKGVNKCLLDNCQISSLPHDCLT